MELSSVPWIRYLNIEKNYYIGIINDTKNNTPWNINNNTYAVTLKVPSFVREYTVPFTMANSPSGRFSATNFHSGFSGRPLSFQPNAQNLLPVMPEIEINDIFRISIVENSM